MNKFKKLLYRQWLKLKAFIEYTEDFKRHIKYSRIYKNEANLPKKSMLCSILVINHQLEKAQTYSVLKRGYGEDKLIKLLAYIKQYLSLYEMNDVIRTSFGVIESHFKNEYAYKDNTLYTEFESLKAHYNLNQISRYGGVINFNTESSPKIIQIDLLQEFFESRRSCRTYSNENITIDEINKAVEMAQSAPSACNRQTTRVHIYQNKKDIEDIIVAQNSDIDWCLEANILFVVTTDLYLLRDTRERNQGMFDAGLFSMNLVHALHSMNIGSCFKMAQKGTKIDNKTLHAGKIPLDEEINVLILAGKYKKEKMVAAKSVRIGRDEIMTIHK